MASTTKLLSLNPFLNPKPNPNLNSLLSLSTTRRKTLTLTLEAVLSKSPKSTTATNHFFSRSSDGRLSVEDVTVEEAMAKAKWTPFYLYNKHRITMNFKAYCEVQQSLDSIAGYAVKANNNLRILEHLHLVRSGAVLVSDNELRATRPPLWLLSQKIKFSRSPAFMIPMIPT